jgi:hypothetical protein
MSTRKNATLVVICLLFLSGTASIATGQEYEVIYSSTYQSSKFVKANENWLVYAWMDSNLKPYWRAINRKSGEVRLLRYWQETSGNPIAGILTSNGMFIFSEREMSPGDTFKLRTVYVFDLNNPLAPDGTIQSVPNTIPPNAIMGGWYYKSLGTDFAYHDEANLLIVTHTTGALVYDTSDLSRYNMQPIQEIEIDATSGMIMSSTSGDYLVLYDGVKAYLYKYDGYEYKPKKQYTFRFKNNSYYNPDTDSGQISYEIYMTETTYNNLIIVVSGDAGNEGAVEKIVIDPDEKYQVKEHVYRSGLGILEAADSHYGIFTPPGHLQQNEDGYRCALVVDLETLSTMAKMPWTDDIAIESTCIAASFDFSNNNVEFFLTENRKSGGVEDTYIIKRYNFTITPRLVSPNPEEVVGGMVANFNPTGLSEVGKDAMVAIVADPDYVIKKLKVGKKIIRQAKGKGGWVHVEDNLEKKATIKVTFKKAPKIVLHRIWLPFSNILGFEPVKWHRKNTNFKWFDLPEGSYFATYEYLTSLGYKIIKVNQDGSINTLTLPDNY